MRTGANGVDREAAVGEERLLATGAARSCSARPSAGRSRALRPRRRPRAGTFSNSNVTTSTPRANARTRIEVVVRRDDLDVGDLPGRRVVLGRERVDAIASRRAAMANMRPSWPLPSTPIVAPGSDRRGVTEAMSRRTSCGHARRGTPAASRAARAATCARIATASSPALAAPAAPIASVATGTPFGICTIDSSESSPLSAALCTGTPRTGSTVCAATMPGRCAAPPAPAMITSSPRAAALVAYSAIHAGVRCAETTRHSCGTPNSRQHLVGVAHRVPVRLAAHDDADERLRLRHGAISSRGLEDTNDHAAACLVPAHGRIALMKRAALLVVLALAAPAAAQTPAAPPKLELPYTQFTLPNGLHVILHEDHSVPIVDRERLVPRRLGAREARAAPASRTCSST